MQLNNFENYLKINLGAKNSIQTYIYRMKDFFANFSKFNQQNLDAYLAKLVDKNLKTSTFNISLIACKHYARFLQMKLIFPKQKKVPKKKRKPFLTQKELEEELFPYFPDLFPNDYEQRKTVLRLLFTSGLRPVEAVNLKESDVDWEKNQIHVTDTKDKEDRVTYLDENIKEELKRSFQNNSLNITKRFITYTFDVINRELNYKKHVNAYMLRHGFGHYMIDSGVDSSDLQKLMGHWDISMTQEYLTRSDDEIINICKKKVKYKKGIQKNAKLF